MALLWQTFVASCHAFPRPFVRCRLGFWLVVVAVGGLVQWCGRACHSKSWAAPRADGAAVAAAPKNAALPRAAAEMRHAIPAAIMVFGRDIENNAIYMWAYLAERDGSAFVAADEAVLAVGMSADDAATIKCAKHWV